MNLPLPVFIGLRYTRSKRRNQFISFVSAFSLLGMVLGCLALIVVMSVMNGFDREIKQRLLQVIPHIELIGEGEGLADWRRWQQLLRDSAGIVDTAPYVSGDAMISFRQGVQGVELRGLRPADMERLSNLSQHMIMGSVSELQAGEFQVILGRLLARYLGVVPGDKITLTLPQLTVTPMGVYPRTRRFTVVGVFEVGAQVDQRLIVTHLDDARKLLRLGDRVSGLELKVENMYRADLVSRQLQHQLPASLGAVSEPVWRLRDWSQTQGSLFAAVKMEKTVVSVLLMIIIAVAAFNIIASLVLMVADKRFDIAVLRTLGLTRRQVMAVFMVQGAAIGWTGVLLGTLAGALIAVNIGPLVNLVEGLVGLQLFDPQVYFISYLPSVLLWSDVLLVVLVGMVLSVLSTLYPAWRASRVEPAEALRYE